jgi:hypothetical protein
VEPGVETAADSVAALGVVMVEVMEVGLVAWVEAEAVKECQAAWVATEGVWVETEVVREQVHPQPVRSRRTRPRERL